MHEQPLTTLTASDLGDGNQVIATGNDGTGDIDTKHALQEYPKTITNNHTR